MLTCKILKTFRKEHFAQFCRIKAKQNKKKRDSKAKRTERRECKSFEILRLVFETLVDKIPLQAICQSLNCSEINLKLEDTNFKPGLANKEVRGIFRPTTLTIYT